MSSLCFDSDAFITLVTHDDFYRNDFDIITFYVGFSINVALDSCLFNLLPHSDTLFRHYLIQTSLTEVNKLEIRQ